MATLKPGSHVVPVQVVADPGIEIVGQRPTTVRVTLLRVRTRRVPVKVQVVTRPPKGYGSNITYQPKSVTVTGPAQLVSQVQEATAYVDLADYTSTIKGPYQLTPENESGSGIEGRLTLKPSQVHITAAIKPFSSYKTLPVLVQFSGLPKQGFGVAGVTVSPAEIAASGSPGVLSDVSTVHTDTISVNHRGGGSFQKTVSLVLPQGVHTVVHRVRVRVNIAPVQSSTSVEIGIQPKGISSGLVMHTIPSRVLVTVTGPSTALRGVARTTHASVNLAGHGPGVYRLRPRVVSSRKHLRVEAVYPRTVTVQVKRTG
jgi:YbbR domain-containing protein